MEERTLLFTRCCLPATFGIIENLANLKPFVGSRMFFVCLPLPLKGIDGSPLFSLTLFLLLFYFPYGEREPPVFPINFVSEQPFMVNRFY
jgi:hypothetical protein